MKLIMTNVELVFPNLFEAKDGKYSATFLVDKKDTENIKAMQLAVKQVKTEKWGETPPSIPAENYFARNGDTKNYDNFKGKYYLTASTKEDFPISLVDIEGRQLTKESNKLKSGDKVNIVLKLWCLDSVINGNHVVRVCANINKIQFVSTKRKLNVVENKDNILFDNNVIEKPQPFNDFDFEKAMNDTEKEFQEQLKEFSLRNNDDFF